MIIRSSKTTVLRVSVRPPSSVQNFTSDLLGLYLLELWTDFDVQGV